MPHQSAWFVSRFGFIRLWSARSGFEIATILAAKKLAKRIKESGRERSWGAGEITLAFCTESMGAPENESEPRKPERCWQGKLQPPKKPAAQSNSVIRLRSHANVGSNVSDRSEARLQKENSKLNATRRSRHKRQVCRFHRREGYRNVSGWKEASCLASDVA
jgi:hypothetical protein